MSRQVSADRSPLGGLAVSVRLRPAPAGARAMSAADPPRRGRRGDADAIAGNLEAHGFRVTTSEDVTGALRRWDAERPDLILLDLGLPDLDGSAVVRHVRRDATTPILILSARATSESRSRRSRPAPTTTSRSHSGWTSCGPASGRYCGGLPARRPTPPASSRLGPVAMDIAARRVTVDGTPVELTPREYELLKVMIASPAGS